MSLKPYAEYKDSGVEWVGGVPKSWRMASLRRIATVVNGGTPTPSEDNWGGDVAWATPVDLNKFDGKAIGPTLRTITVDGLRSGSSSVPAKSVLLSTRAPIGYVSLTEGEMAFNQGCKGLVPKADGAVSEFLMYALLAGKAELVSRGQGTTFLELSTGALMACAIPVPTLNEQQDIVAYLDLETAEIDAFIADQEELIGLLNERRAALADTLVWGGSSSYAERQPMPINPLPDVPSHWKVLRNKNIWRESNRLSDDGAEEMLTVSHITGVTPRSEKNVTMFEAASTEGYRLVSPGNLAINTMWAWMGALGTSAYSGIVSPAYGVYESLGQEIEHRYFHHLYRSSQYVRLMTNFSRGLWSSRLRLYPWSFLALPTAVPPFAEQVSISDQIDSETAEIDAAIADAQEAIALSKERRAAVISDAVTGKIDVRDPAMIEQAKIQGEPVGVA